jgi:hypothetical protein
MRIKIRRGRKTKASCGFAAASGAGGRLCVFDLTVAEKILIIYLLDKFRLGCPSVCL